MSLSHSLEFETQHECNMEELDSEDEDIPGVSYIPYFIPSKYSMQYRLSG